MKLEFETTMVPPSAGVCMSVCLCLGFGVPSVVVNVCEKHKGSDCLYILQQLLGLVFQVL